MPELPEVETTLRGLQPYLEHQTIDQVIVRESRLRWPIPANLKQVLAHQTIQQLQRRGKYLLIQVSTGTILLHLGMSGRLRLLHAPVPAAKHDHVDMVMANGVVCRFTDPRRFGCLLWTDTTPTDHPLLRSLGPEPLNDEFSAHYLYQLSRNRKIAIKQFIMNSHVVVGVGNIYANEALFVAQISPFCSANQISLEGYERLVTAIKHVLQEAIACGGTTLRDFLTADGDFGNFKPRLMVYGRTGKACMKCEHPLSHQWLNGRISVYCPQCQPEA